MDLKVNWKL